MGSQLVARVAARRTPCTRHSHSRGQMSWAAGQGPRRPRVAIPSLGAQVLERNHIELPVASLPEVPICLQ